jgi:hypothetical protein
MGKAKLNKLRGLCEEAAALAGELRDEAQEKYDNLSEKSQEGEAGEKAQARAETLGEIADALEGLDFDSLENA